MTADAVADLRARGVTTPVYVSVQVETAWGQLAGTNGAFVGIDQDLRDFALSPEPSGTLSSRAVRRRILSLPTEGALPG